MGKGKVYATCGHDVTGLEIEEATCRWADWYQGEEVLSTGVLCPDCKEVMKDAIKRGEELAKKWGLI